MEETVGTRAAAQRVGVSPQTLLTWERRFGFPKPARNIDGSRCYPEALVSVLIFAKARRSTGMPVAQALELAKREFTASEVRNANPLPASHILAEALERVTSSVAILSGPSYVIEFANQAHRSLYPGRRIVGIPGVEGLTHSSAQIDLSGTLQTVAATGHTLTWSRQPIQMFGEERWWDFSYGRLPLHGDEPVRLIMQARDVTDDVYRLNRAEAAAQEASQLSQDRQEAEEAFHVLARLVERRYLGAEFEHPEILSALRSGMDAEVISLWAKHGANWRRVAVSGGQSGDAQTGRAAHSISSGTDWEELERAASASSVIQMEGMNLLPNHLPSHARRSVALCAVGRGKSDQAVVVAVEHSHEQLTDAKTRLLHAACHLFGAALQFDS